MKKKYIVPEISVFEFEVEDIVTDSALISGEVDPDSEGEIDFGDIFGSPWCCIFIIFKPEIKRYE